MKTESPAPVQIPGRPEARRSMMGFSLIEVLSAMAVLSVIVMIVARLFSNSTSAWDAGTRRMNANLAARSTLDMIGREISQVGVSSNTCLRVTDMGSGSSADPNDSSDRLEMVTNSGTPSVSAYKRDFYQAKYEVRGASTNAVLRYSPNEAENDPGFTCSVLGATPWWSSTYSTRYTFPQDVLFGVVSFKVNVFNTNAVYQANYDSTIHGPPLYADMFLSLIDETDRVRASQMGATKSEYIRRKMWLYSKRVYFRNRMED